MPGKHRLIGFKESFRKWSNYGKYYICYVEHQKFFGLYSVVKSYTIFWSDADMMMTDPEKYYNSKLNIWYDKKEKNMPGKKRNKAKVVLRACVFQIGVNILGLPMYRAHIISDIPSKIKYTSQVKEVDYLN